jgi:inner membrane protein
MYPRGHLGISLLLYAPVALFLGVNGFYFFAILGFLMTGAFATIPDKDMNAPLVSHRGISHSIAAALLFGVVLSFVAVFFVPVLSLVGIPVAPFVGFVFVIGAWVVLTHLMGDALTPAGIKPFAPISDKEISLGFVRAESSIANLLLWVAGWIVIILVGLLVLGTFIA